MNFSRKLTYIRALLLPFRVTPVYTLLSILRDVINLAIAPVSVLVTAYFIDTALLVVGEGLSASRIVLPLVALGVFQLYGYIVWPLFHLTGTKAWMKATLKMRVPLVEKRARLEYKHLENTETVDLLNRVWENPEHQIIGMLQTMQGFVVLLGTTIAYAVILITHAPLAGSLLILLSVPMFYISIRAGKENYQARRDKTERDRQVGTIGWYVQGREPAGERNLFGYAPKMTEKYFAGFEEVRKWQLRINAIWFARSKGASILLGLLSTAALFMLAPAVASGSMSVGLYIALLGALFSTVNNMGWSLPWHFQQFTTQREYLKEFNQFLELTETKDADALPAANPPKFERLEFRNVSFTYPGTEKLILDGLSMTLESGRHYSFVGVNGAGKTTITKLITRLYDNYEGEILLNGIELRQWAIPDIKAMFCALFQDFVRYDVTVAENAAIGKANGTTEEEIDRALQLSGFDQKAESLKDGKNTLLGKTHDAGVDLSGGEWQRLAFARAIISPAAVKILDEPTAALDPVAESQVYAQFEQISKGITTIFISHRLASAKMADVIYVLERGKVTEKGNHDTLMQQKGTYAEMFESQRGWYT
ncbi:MAG: ABC transporter ATP-binding protein/permease [Defluviitaleaceae bacterium]|nr:ABC transporter ATP-binding protein/permease [Defluviitaleaceae bacterium]MCL2274944.1 ABC transporter ATP-binding protein/permease [Defluviitaleaceae bacterium]